MRASRPKAGRYLLAGLLASSAAMALLPPAEAAPPRERREASLRFASRLGSAVRGRLHEGWEHAVPVVIALDGPLTADLAAKLERHGARIERGKKGLPLGARRFAATIDAATSHAIANEPGVARVSLDGRPYAAPRPLDLTRSLISADAVGRTRGEDGTLLRGEGITICDVDTGIDVFHPSFFRADGGLFAWTDENDNGVLDPGVDTVDLGEGPVVIRALNGVVVDRQTGDPKFGTEDEKLDLKYDYLYADEDGDGEREFGAAAGFTDETPSLGEQLFVADDVDRSGAIEVGEKIVALKTSKVKAFRRGIKVYRRGEDLSEVKWDADMMHGTGATAVLAAGQPDYGTLVGMAPDADLVVATETQGGSEFAMTSFCLDEGAKVVLHEYAPWVGYHLDGSSDLEQLIDESVAEGVVHINPAGNLSTAKKGYKRSIAAGATTEVPIRVPELGITYLITSFLWRDTGRDLSFVVDVPDEGPIDLGDLSEDVSLTIGHLQIAAFRSDSDRGTARVDLYAYDPTSGVPVGDWRWSVVDPADPSAAPLTLFGYVFDEISGWSQGAYFTESVSEDHLIGWPATADHGMAIAAFIGHDFDGQTAGERAWYSGRGRRIDDAPILSISAPANPIVPTRTEDYALSYLIYGGTSGASPHVAGAAALYLQARGAKSGDEVKQAFEQHALVDDATGSVPNEDYGRGKLDVHAAIFGDRAPSGTAPVVTAKDQTVERGASTLTIAVTDAEDAIESITLDIDRDYDGVFDDELAGATFDATFDEAGDYVMKVRATDPSGRTGQALLRVHVVEPIVDEGGGGSGGSGAGEESPAGGGCAVDGGSGSTGAAWLGALAVVALRRRRKAR